MRGCRSQPLPATSPRRASFLNAGVPNESSVPSSQTARELRAEVVLQDTRSSATSCALRSPARHCPWSLYLCVYAVCVPRGDEERGNRCSGREACLQHTHKHTHRIHTVWHPGHKLPARESRGTSDRVAVLWSPPPCSVSAPRAAGFKCALAGAPALLPGGAARLAPRSGRGASLPHPQPSTARRPMTSGRRRRRCSILENPRSSVDEKPLGCLRGGEP